MRMTIGKKCMLLTAISTGLLLAVTGAGYWGIRAISAGSERMLRVEARVAEQAAAARTAVVEMRRYEKDMFLNCLDLKKVEEYEKQFREQHANLGKHLEALRDLAVAARDRDRVSMMNTEIKTYMTAMNTIIPRVKSGEIKTPQEGNKAIGEYKETIHQMEKTADELAREGNARMAEIGGEMNGQGSVTLAIMAAISAAAVLLGLVSSLLLSRSITARLHRMVAPLEDIAEGNLTRRVEIAGQDEIGDMARLFNTSLGKMHDIVVGVKEAGEQVAGASQQLAATAEQLSAGTQEQASSLEETAASLEEITSSVKQNADNAQQANQLAAGSRSTAEKGGQVVGSAVRAMGEINEASRKITDIITTIDEIAFQTNLLALNAAVEAARAGDQGRGFAVVAAEVRSLAQRSAAAAREIKALIQDSVSKAAAGSDLVGKSGQTLEEIVASVRRVTDLMAEIAASSQEQSGGINQVNHAVAQMDNVVQQNAAQTEELSSTAQSLAAHASQLQALIGRFKLADEPAAPRFDLAQRDRVSRTLPAKARGPRPPAARAVPFQGVSRVGAEDSGLGNGKTEKVMLGSAAARKDGFEEF